VNIIINSSQTCLDCIAKIKEKFNNDKYLRVTIKGKSRTIEQNRWIYEAYTMISQQTGDTPQEVRRFCKFTFGLVILFADDEESAKRWRRVAKTLGYEEMLLAMDMIDVTSKFTVKQLSRYIESMLVHYQGLMLPESQD